MNFTKFVDWTEKHPTNPYLVVVKAEWCIHCKRLEPSLPTIKEMIRPVKLVVLDGEENDIKENLSRFWDNTININSFPTLVLGVGKNAFVYDKARWNTQIVSDCKALHALKQLFFYKK